MTKMTKRIGAAMLSTALLLGALTGCGGNTSSSTDGDNAASTSTDFLSYRKPIYSLFFIFLHSFHSTARD